MSWQHHGADPARPEAGDTVTLASDGDRDAAARLLNEAFAEGRLTADEHGERVRSAYAARTWHDLAQVTAGLPAAAQAARPAATGTDEGLDRCLLCALLICCPPVAIASLVVTRRRARAAQRRALTAAGPPSAACGPAAPTAVAWRAEDR